MKNNIFGLIYTTYNVFIIKLDICSTVELHHIDIIFILTGINKASMSNNYMLSILEENQTHPILLDEVRRLSPLLNIGREVTSFTFLRHMSFIVFLFSENALNSFSFLYIRCKDISTPMKRIKLTYIYIISCLECSKLFIFNFSTLLLCILLTVVKL